MNTFKLASRKGTLLGTVTVPDDVAEYLNGERGQRDYASMAVLPRLPFLYPPQPEDVPGMLGVMTVTFRRSYYMRDAIEIHGISLEEFEKLPGCSFSPGAGYLRSVVTEGNT